MSDTKQAKALTFGNHSLWKLGTLVWFVHTVISEHIMLCTQLQNLVFLIGRCAIYELAQYAVVKDAANYTDTLPEQDMETLETSFHQAITLGQNQVTKNTEESLTIQDSRSGREEPSPVSTSPGPSVTTLQSRKSEASVLPTDAPKITDRPQKGKVNITHFRSAVN